MSSRIFSGILLSFLLIGILTCAFKIQSGKAQLQEFSKIDISSYVTIEQAMVGYPAVAHDNIRVPNIFNFTLHNVTVSIEAYQSLESPPFEVDLDFGDIPANQTGIERYNLYNGTQVMPDVTLIDAFGYEDMRTLSIISVQVPSQTVAIGQSTNITGSITPILAGVNITIYYTLTAVLLPHSPFLDNTEGNWTTIATVATDENGIYSCEWTPSDMGTYQLKANWTGDQNTQPTESSNITLNCVRIATTISIFASSSSTIVGFRVTITGALTDEFGNALASEPVVLYWTSIGIGTWNLITSAVTDASGNYSSMWIPSATGTFTIEATWDGLTNSLTEDDASNNVTLISLPYLNQYVFSVESNSTVSNLVFDTSQNILSFSVSGESRTSGYTTVTIAKSLIVDATKLDVLIDGNPYNYTLTETSDSWVLAFTYEHSTHTVEIDLEAALVPEFSNVLILFLLITLASAVLVTEKKKNRKAVQQLKTN